MEQQSTNSGDGKQSDQSTKDTVALELTKFIATSTGFGRGAAAVGFGGKSAKTPEEQVNALLELFEKCREAVYRR